ncbi:hypothetical protein PG985_007704 [Apiospora marii]|uniref:uncharacterized protein n=1 Tax=Apiospora marii TaxID=335849 RepID=UPI00312D8693
MSDHVSPQQYSPISYNDPNDITVDTLHSHDHQLVTWDLGTTQTLPFAGPAATGSGTTIKTPWPRRNNRETDSANHKTSHPSVNEPPFNLQERGDHAAASRAIYKFHRHTLRSSFNIVGPVLVVLFYVLIVFHYLRRPAVNGIMPDRIVDANIVFYAWTVLAIFMLDWAKSALAGFEAAALMRPALAPSNARQLLWHNDKAWGSPGGWWKVLRLSVDHAMTNMTARQRRAIPTLIWRGPRWLWAYLAGTSLLFFVALPLSSLSFEQGKALRRSTRLVEVSGVNRTTFNLRSWGNLPEVVDKTWRQGNPVTPFGETVFYAPKGSSDVSSTFYEDSIQDIYQRQSESIGNPQNQTISFFSGPQVTERAFGSAWGLLTDISCLPMSPYDPKLQFFNVTSIDDWASDLDGGEYPTNSTAYAQRPEVAKVGQGLSGIYRDIGQSFGVSYQYLLASDFFGWRGSSSYSDHPWWPLPIHGHVETVLWQVHNATRSYPEGIASHPLVAHSKSAVNNATYLGYAVQCAVVTDVGVAKLSAETNTFEDFRPEPAPKDQVGVNSNDKVTDWQGVEVMQAIVYAALTGLALHDEHVSKCNSNLSKTCNPWMGATMALNMVPDVVDNEESAVGGGGQQLQLALITPEQMTLAMHKLFGVAAAEMMGQGPGNWTSEGGLYGLDPANDLVPGRVPYLFVLGLLAAWAAFTVFPQLWALSWGRRWTATLDGFVLFRLGAEWRDAVHELSSDNLGDSGTDCLARVPGLVGDMRRHDISGADDEAGIELQEDGNPLRTTSHRSSGFVGLSNAPASSRRGKTYSWN